MTRKFCILLLFYFIYFTLASVISFPFPTTHLSIATHHILLLQQHLYPTSIFAVTYPASRTAVSSSYYSSYATNVVSLDVRLETITFPSHISKRLFQPISTASTNFNTTDSIFSDSSFGDGGEGGIKGIFAYDTFDGIQTMANNLLLWNTKFVWLNGITDLSSCAEVTMIVAQNGSVYKSQNGDIDKWEDISNFFPCKIKQIACYGSRFNFAAICLNGQVLGTFFFF